MDSRRESDGSRSLGSVVRDLSDDLRTLLRAEIALAKLEIRESVTGMGAAAGMFGVAAFLLTIAGVLLIVTLVLVLALWLPAWAATLILSVLLVIGAVLLILAGKNKMKRTSIAPTGTIDSVRTDFRVMRGSVRRESEHR